VETQQPDHLCSEYLTCYHKDQPHQWLGNRPTRNRQQDPPVAEVVPLEPVRYQARLGSLLKSYGRKAA
jgi:hypothetical protein